MTDIDREFLGIIGGVIIVFAALMGLVYFEAYRPEPAKVDLTDSYAMPPELAGSRVYRLSPKGTGRTLYVVTKDDEPAATAWNEQSGKHTHRVEVVTP
jgi:hypothetical protein